MVYCPKCGKKNEDDAKFCSSCGASLTAKKDYEKEWEDRCEKECSRGPHAPIIWGIIVVLIGLWIIFEFVLEKIPGMPSWVSDFPFWGIFALLVGIMIIIWGLRMMTKK